jgi:hypothetical protein
LFFSGLKIFGRFRIFNILRVYRAECFEPPAN